MISVFKNIFIILISLFLILVGLDFVIDNPYTQKFFRAYISDIVEKESNLALDFEGLEIGLVPLQLDFFGLTLSVKTEQPAPPLATATQLKVTVSLISLFFARPNFLDIDIDGLNLKWPPGAPLSPLRGPDETSELAPLIPIGQVHISNSQFLFDFAPGETSVSSVNLSGVNIVGSFERWDDFQASLSAMSVNLTVDDKEILSGTRLLISQLTFTGHEFDLRHLLVKDNSFSLQGGINGFLGFEHDKLRSVKLDANLDADADLRILDHWFDMKKTSGGAKAKVHFYAHVPVDYPGDTSFVAEGEAEAIDAYLAGNRIYNARSFFKLDNEKVAFDNLELKVGDKNHANLVGEIVFSKQVDFEFHGKAWDLPLTQIVSSFDEDLTVIDFIANTDTVHFKGTGSPFSMELWADGELTDLHFPELPIKPDIYRRRPSCRVQAHLFFTEYLLDFKDTEGVCYIPPEKLHPQAKPDRMRAPEGALFASSVSVRDIIHFRDGPNMKIFGVNADLGLSQSFFQVDLNGVGDVETHIVEENKEVRVINSFDVHSLAFQKVFLGDAKGTLTVVKDHMFWDDVSIEKGDRTFYGEHGRYLWKEDRLQFSVEGAHLSAADIELFSAIAREEGIQPYSFAIDSFRGTFDIPVKDPWHSRNSLEMKLSDVFFKENLLATGINATVLHNGNEFRIPKWTVNFGSLSLTGQAILKKARFDSFLAGDDFLNLTFTTAKVDDPRATNGLTQLEKIQPIKTYLDPLKIAGMVDVTGELRGEIASLSGHWEGRFSSLKINRFPVYPVNFQGFLNTSHLQVYLSQSGNNLVGRMDVDISTPGQPFSWYFKLKQFDMRPFTKDFFYQDARNFAYLTASWALEGKLDQWWQANGKLMIDDLRMNIVPHGRDPTVNPLVIRNTAPAVLLSSSRGWVFENPDGLEIEGDGVTANLQLSEMNRPPESLDMRIHSDLDLRLLTQFFPGIQSATGTVNARTRISGSVINPNVASSIRNVPAKETTGTLPLSLNIPTISPAIQDIEIDANYLNGILTVKKVSGKKGKGMFKIEGLVNLSSEQQKPMTLVNIKLDKLSLNYPLPYLRMIQTVLDGELTVSGLGKPFDVAGNINIVSAQTERTLDTKAENIREIPIGDMVRGFREDETSFFNYNIAVEGTRSIRVQNPAMNLIMSSDIVLKGTNEKPIIEGIFKVDEGKFRYQRDFVISRAELVFDNPLQNDPKLDILARSEFNPYTITVYISGEGTKPLIDIHVDPPTKEDGSIITRLDAIILLSQGKLPAAESRTQDTRNVGVMTAFNLYASQLPFHKFNELTGQRYISPYVNYTTDEQGNLVPQLNVPIHITNVIEAVVRQIPNTTLLTVEFPIHHNISVSGNASSTQRRTDVIQEESQFQSGIDMRFAFPFK
ncbi:MAG: translocation/assembly module TamB domain-containing protein [Deltaproteobacteria bacterium]|nr:translocation/assembly module TamB domain-containing protein [Deltaproteobacteria bacterium]